MLEPQVLRPPPPLFEQLHGAHPLTAVTEFLQRQLGLMTGAEPLGEVAWIVGPAFLRRYMIMAADELLARTGVWLTSVPGAQTFVLGSPRRSCAARLLLVSNELVPGMRLVTTTRCPDGDVHDTMVGLLRNKAPLHSAIPEGVIIEQLRAFWNIVAAQVESHPRSSRSSMDGLFLLPGQKEEIGADFDAFLGAYEVFKELGLQWRRGYLFHGPPGNGKSRLIRELCHSRGLAAEDVSSRINNDGELLLSKIEMPADLTSDMGGRRGEIEKSLDLELGTDTLRTLLSARTPEAFYIEDLDKFVAFQAGETRHKDAAKISLNDFLKALDGVDSAAGVILLMTTNYPDMIAESLVRRPGRVDRIWNIGLPRREEMTALIKHMGYQCKGYPPEKIAAELFDQKASMAFAEELVRSLCMVHRRKTFSAKEVEKEMQVLLDHLSLTDPDKPRWKGHVAKIGLGI